MSTSPFSPEFERHIADLVAADLELDKPLWFSVRLGDTWSGSQRVAKKQKLEVIRTSDLRWEVQDAEFRIKLTGRTAVVGRVYLEFRHPKSGVSRPWADLRSQRLRNRDTLHVTGAAFQLSFPRFP